MYIVGVSDEALHSNEVFPEATDEHKGEDSDNVDKVDEVKRLQEGEFFLCERYLSYFVQQDVVYSNKTKRGLVFNHVSYV